MPALNWTQLYEKYKGLWVALLEDEVTVVASGASARETLLKAKKKGYKEPILFRVPTIVLPYVGTGIRV